MTDCICPRCLSKNVVEFDGIYCNLECKKCGLVLKDSEFYSEKELQSRQNNSTVISLD